ncbi:26S protease regulatory subunit 7, putative [Entamoeba histolytica KU27]|uniref:26S protease regulatory subunit 7, putative n=1 Tax=Entamoeba histolytica KU27 TaxID=885311 RepID=M2S6B9_ENTHI|nr:26S protease regulatory subunit 7, putative [Entamoeba histolytica KU27]
MEEDFEKKPKALDEEEIAILKAYNRGPYANSIKQLEKVSCRPCNRNT